MVQLLQNLDFIHQLSVHDLGLVPIYQMYEVLAAALIRAGKYRATRRAQEKRERRIMQSTLFSLLSC